MSYNEYGINIKNEEMFFLKSNDQFETDFKLPAIKAFTTSNYLLHLIFKMKGFSLKKIEDGKLCMTYKNESIQFSRISDLLISNNNETIKLKKQLLNINKRRGECHVNSTEYINCGDYLVTGYISGDKYSIIHSWVETDKNVIDFTLNLVIKKEDYYKMMNAQVLSIIKKENVYDELNSSFSREFLGVKFYCLFRDELYRAGLFELGQDEIIKKKEF